MSRLLCQHSRARRQQEQDRARQERRQQQRQGTDRAPRTPGPQGRPRVPQPITQRGQDRASRIPQGGTPTAGAAGPGGQDHTTHTSQDGAPTAGVVGPGGSDQLSAQYGDPDTASEGDGGLGVRASFEAFVTERAEAARWDAVARASWAHSVLDACKVWGGTGLSDVALLRESLLGAPLVPRAAQVRLGSW